MVFPLPYGVAFGRGKIAFFLCFFRENRPPTQTSYLLKRHLLNMTDSLLNQGMDVIFVEDPLGIQKGQPDIPISMEGICEKQNIPLKGNAAGNYKDFLNLTGRSI